MNKFIFLKYLRNWNKHFVWIDINECKLQTHKCSKHARCLNGQGGYKCECSKGYSGDGFNCTGLQKKKINILD